MSKIFSLIFCVLLVIAVAFVSASSQVEQARRLAKKTSYANHREYRLALRQLQHLPEVQTFIKANSNLLPYPSSGCTTCTGILNYLVLPSFESQSGIDGLINTTQKGLCAKMNVTLEQKICNDLVNVTFNVLGKVFTAGKKGGWNVAEDICADLLGMCYAPCCTTPYTPEQLSLNFGSQVVVSNSMSMRINWLTLNRTTGDFIAFKQTNSNNSSWTIVPSSAISQSNSSADEIWKWYGYYHSGLMTGLNPGTSYTYFVGSSQGNSTQNTFTTLPLNVGTANRSLRIAVVADYGTHNADQTTAQILALANSGSIDAMFMIGDLGYWDGKMERLADFGRQIEPIASKIPIAAVPGNHDTGFLSFFSEYMHRYPMLPAGFGAPANALYWSMNIGPVNFLLLNTETFFDSPDLGEKQMAWAVGRLAAFDIVPGAFTQVFQHRPLYCSAGDNKSISGTCYGGADSDLLRAQSEYHMNKHHVDFHVSGHVHNLNTMYPVRDGQPVGRAFTFPQAPVYAVVGNAGQEESLSNFYPNPLPWDRVRQSVIGYQVFEYVQKVRAEDNKIHTSCKFTAYQSSDNTVLDTFEIVSGR